PALLAVLRYFPTRRSSDLVGLIRILDKPREWRSLPCHRLLLDWCRGYYAGGRLRSKQRDQSGRGIVGNARLAENELPTCEASGRDRKSTRLNSSHGSISYA